AVPPPRAPPFPYTTLFRSVRLTADACEIWAGDQFQTIDQANAARVAGLPPERVTIHTVYAGGSFGRRANAESDYIVEAVSIAKRSEEHTSELQSLRHLVCR